MAKRALSLFIFTLGCLCISNAQAQNSTQIDTSSQVDVRLPSESTIEGYANDPDFQYLLVPENPNSLRERVLNYLFRFLSRLIGNPIGGFIFRAILIVAVVSLVFVLVNQLMGGELTNVFRKNKEEGFSLGIAREELENTDYEQLIKQAIQTKNYQAATRFGYLVALKLLSQNELISWGLEKTNLDYLKELNGHPTHPDFRVLTTYYEFVEYGDFEIDNYQFETFNTTFKRFKIAVNEQ